MLRLPSILAAVCLMLATGCAEPSVASEPPEPTPTYGRVLVAVHDVAPPTAEPEPAFAPLATPAALALATPLPTPLPTPPPRPAVIPAAVDLPILMYHRIQEVPRGSRDPILSDLSVPPGAFRQHAAMLRSLGVVTVSLDDALDYLYGRRLPPDRAVVLTFDDGYDNTYTEAFPALRAFGMRGTVFVITDFVGQPGYLTWDQLRDLARAGWAVESHSASHLDLRDLPAAELQRQLLEPRFRIQQEIGRAPSFLNYPAGKYNRRVIDAAALAGYRAAVTVNYGTRLTLPRLFELPRVRIHGLDGPDAVKAAVQPPTRR